MSVDPVCHMVVNEQILWKCEYQGKPYYFCSQQRRKWFDRDRGTTMVG